MSCTFTFAGLAPVMSGGQLVGINLQGLVQFSDGSSCTTLDVKLTCGDQCIEQQIPIFQFSANFGYFSGAFTNLPSWMTNCCGHDVTVTVGCPGCGYQTFVLPLNCAKKCPDLATIMCEVGPCQYNGSVQLNCNAQVTALNGYPGGITLQWKQNGNPVGSPVTMTAPGWVPMVFTLPGAGQTVNLLLEIINPVDACPPIGMTVTLPACGQGCQPIQIDSKIGECNKDGTRPVTITAVLTGGTSTTQISATMTTPCGTAVTGSGTGSLTLTSSCDLSPGTYTVTVTAAGCHPQSYTFTVLECCPKITISHTAGDCHSDDTRPVTITAVLTGVSSALPITATMTGPCGPVSQSGTGSVTLTSSCALSAGTYTVTVTAVGCPSQTYTFTIKECCPKIVISHAVKDCNPDGTIPVIITAVLTAGSASTPIDATMTSPCGTTPGTGAGTVTLTDSCNLNTGSYTVTVTAADCPSQIYTFNVEDCCPKVDFKAIVKGKPICNADHTRPVVFKATVTPHNGVQTTATLTDSASGSVIATGSGTTPFVLTGSRPYDEGSHQVEVSFASPLNCPPRHFQFCVPLCETPTCLNNRKLLIVLLTVAITISCMNGIAVLANYLDGLTSGSIWWALGRYLDYRFTPPLPATIGAIQVAAFIAAGVLLIWWWLCIRIWKFQIGGCCWACCIFRIILWQVPLMVGLCLLWFLPTIWSLNLVSALVLFLISYLFFLWWRKNCCPGKCDTLFHLTTAVAMWALAIVIIEFSNVTSISVIAPNSASAYVPWYIMVLWIVTGLLRLYIGWKIYDLWQKYVDCMSEPD